MDSDLKQGHAPLGLRLSWELRLSLQFVDKGALSEAAKA